MLLTIQKGQQVLLMRINFDELDQAQLPNGNAGVRHVRVEIQSPVCNRVIGEVSAGHIGRDLDRIAGVVDVPTEMGHFIKKQLEKQMSAKVTQQVVDAAYFIKNNSRVVLEQSREHKIAQKMEKQNKKPLMTKDFNYKKHRCQQQLPTSVRQTLQQLGEFTGRPALNTSAAYRRVQTRRNLQDQANAKKRDVFEGLYRNGMVRKSKASMAQQLMYETRKAKPKVNSSYFKDSKKKYVPLYSRLNQILQTRETKRRQRQAVDPATGKQLFRPDLSRSRESYHIYAQSLSKQKLAPPSKHVPSNPPTPNANHKSKPAVASNRSCKHLLDDKTIDYFMEIFYPQESALAPQQQQQHLSKAEFEVLQRFLHDIEELESRKCEMETTVSSSKLMSPSSKGFDVLSRQQFRERLTKFYENLSLHDRQILRMPVQLNRLPKYSKMEEAVHTFKPVINVRSASLDNLRHHAAHQIYYV